MHAMGITEYGKGIKLILRPALGWRSMNNHKIHLHTSNSFKYYENSEPRLRDLRLNLMNLSRGLNPPKPGLN